MGRFRDAAGRAVTAARSEMQGTPGAGSRAWQAADSAARFAAEVGHPGLSAAAGVAAGAAVMATAAFTPDPAPDAMDAVPYATFTTDRRKGGTRS